MKKILRLVTTSVLTLTLVACGEASSSVSTSGTQTSSSVSSPSTSAFANVTTITLTAASDTLTQVLGSLKRVTVSAALNANTNPALALEWFVDGVKSNQTGRIFEFTPTAVGNFVLQAKVGNVLSNTVTVAVGQGGLAVETAKFADADTIELKAPGGATVTVVGQEVADTSYYSLAKGTYVIDLKKAVAQGTTVTVNLAGADGKSVAQQVTFDTQEFSLDEVNYFGEEVTAVSGVYRIVKPFDAGALFRRSYTLSFEQKNIVSATVSTLYTVETTVPAGATAVPASSLLVNALQTNTFFVDSTTAPGIYTHKITLGRKSVEVKVEVVNAVAEIVIPKLFEYTNAVTTNKVKFDFANLTNDLTDVPNLVTEVVAQNSLGQYVITKPYETSGTTLRRLQFQFHARNFEKRDFVNNQYSVTLNGPSQFSTTPVILFSGMETLNTSNGNAAILNNDLSFENFVGNVAGYSNDTNALGTVMQFFDSGTPNGVYTFKISAGISGQQISKDVQVLVQSPAPKLDFFLAGLNSSVDTITTGLNNSELGLSTRAQVVTTTADGTFVIEKPSFDGVTYNLSWLATLQNYQSSLVRTSEINEVTNDNLLSNPDSKKLFNDASGIKKLDEASGSNRAWQFNDANLLVKRGVTVGQPINVVVKQTTGGSAPTLSVSLPARSTGTGLTVTHVNPLASLGAANGATATVKIADYTTTAAATLGLVQRITISGGHFVINGVETTTFDVQVSDFPDVLELGSGTVAANSHYRFVNVNLSVNGPQAIFENFASPRTALLLAANTNGLLLFNATGTDLDTQGTSTTEAKVRAYAGATFNMDKGYNSDPQDSAVDSSGLWRKQLAITNTTVAGVYTFKFSVDNIVKEVKIQINNPTPKVFVMSGIDMLDNSDVDTLKNNSATSLAPSTILSPLHTQYALGGNEFKFATSGTGYNRLQTYDVDGILPGTANYVPSLFDNFVAPNASDVYTVYLPNRALTNRDMLYARIAVADLAKGEYDYEITKKYPDGRVETFSDKVKVTAVDNNQIATFDSTNSKFITNWIINETSFTDGTYEYSFKVNNIEKKLTINVLDAPTLDVTKVLTGTVARPLFNGSYVIAADTLAANTSTTGTALSFEFDKINVTDTQFYSVGYSFLEKDNTTLTGTKALSDTFALISGTLDTTKISSIKDLNKISLGSFRRGSNAPEAGDYIQFNIKIYDAVAKSIAASGYRQAGEDIVLQVLVAATIPLIDKYITVTNDGSITKGQEDGEVLTVRVFGDTFAPGSGNVNITTSNFTFKAGSEQPSNVTIGSVRYIDANTVQLVLRGNATNDYTDANVDATVIEVLAGALTGNGALSTKATTLFKTAPTTTQAVVSMTSATTENGTIIVTLPSGVDFSAVSITADAASVTSAGFKVEIVDRFGNATALPSGLTVDTAAASDTSTKLTLILAGDLTALYWTDNQRVRVTIPKTVVETVGGNVDVLADIVVVTTFRDLKPVGATAADIAVGTDATNTKFTVTLDDDWYFREADGSLTYMTSKTSAELTANTNKLLPFSVFAADGTTARAFTAEYNSTNRVFTVTLATQPAAGGDESHVNFIDNKIFDKNGNASTGEIIDDLVIRA